MKLSHLLYFGAAFAALFCISHSNAATITVTNTSDSGAGTLRQAIIDNEAAGGGNTINFSVTGAITLTSDRLVITKDVTITGPGARLLTVQRSTAGGTPDFGIFRIEAGTVNISRLTFANASGTDAALSHVGGPTVNVSDCSITGNNITGFGGGVFSQSGTVTLSNCSITNNTALQGGGVQNQATMILHNCTVANNTATTTSTGSGGGGGIANTGTLTLVSCTITGNSATTNSTSGGGGGVLAFNGTVHIGNTIVASNSTNQTGDDVRGDFASDGYNFIRNGDGASGFNRPGDLVGTSQGLINANLGPLQNNGGPTDTRSPISPSNTIDHGNSFGLTTDQRGRARINDNPNIPNVSDGTDIGAVEVQPPITSTVTNNNDTFEGSLRERILDADGGDTIDFAPNVTGTINLTGGPITIDRGMTIAGPGARSLTVTNPGGSGFVISGSAPVIISGLTIANSFNGVDDSGDLSMSDCAIVNNGGLVFGGGLYVPSPHTLNLTRCTISGNSGVDGGGIYNTGTAILSNCTIANNIATYSAPVNDGGQGGGIYNFGSLSLTNCTVSGNTATGNPSAGGGGGLELNGTVHLANTLVAGNTTDGTGPDVHGAATSDGYNLIRIGNGSTGFTNGVNHDLVGTANNPTDAFLGALRNNGGQTDTKALGSLSPAINAANDATAPDEDQRKYIRSDTADIGAFEFNATNPVTLANISTRALVGTGDNVLIGGFIITGTDNKKVILRAIGPSLSIPGRINDPILELHASGGQTIVTNDNWRDAANMQEIIDSGIPPTNDLESAILITLDPGAYTAVMQGANNATGVGVVEAYDLDRTGNSILANISTRVAVQTGENVLIGGFIVLGTNYQRVIARAIGPSLAIPGAMADPTLELHDSNGAVIGSNDNWRTDQEAEIIATTIPPSNDLESAVVRNVFPGNYTAIVGGVNGTTGVAVVEIYALN